MIKKMRTLKTRSERSGLWEGRVFHPSGAIRDVGPRKMPVANGSAGGSFDALFKLSRGRRNLQGWGKQGSHSRTWAARTRMVASGFRAQQFSRGVDSNDKDLLWLLAPTKFDK